MEAFEAEGSLWTAMPMILASTCISRVFKNAFWFAVLLVTVYRVRAQSAIFAAERDTCPNSAAWRWGYQQDYPNRIDWKYRTREDLDKILKQHEKWIQQVYLTVKNFDPSYRDVQPQRADFRGAELQGACFAQRDLRWAVFGSDGRRPKTDLTVADFRGAALGGADMRNVLLEGANFGCARLASADFSGADLWATVFGISECQFGTFFQEDEPSGEAKFVTARLGKADFGNAWFDGYSFKGANFFQSRLKAASFHGSDLSGVLYLPAEGADPNPDRIWDARNLDELQVADTATSLVHLRDSLRVVHPGAAMKVNAAIYRANETVWQSVFLDATCEFGAAPWRPVEILIVVWFGFAFVYSRTIRTGRGGGLLLVVTRDGSEGARTRKLKLKVVGSRAGNKWSQAIRSSLEAYRRGLLFSLFAAFSLPFKEFDPGRWLRLLMCREFDIRPVGQLRFFAGVQTLTCYYLLVLCILSFLQTPFIYGGGAK